MQNNLTQLEQNMMDAIDLELHWWSYYVCYHEPAEGSPPDWKPRLMKDYNILFNMKRTLEGKMTTDENINQADVIQLHDFINNLDNDR